MINYPAFKPDNQSWVEGRNYFFTRDLNGNVWYCVIEEEGELIHNLPRFDNYKFSIPYGILNQKYYGGGERIFQKVISDDNLTFSMKEI